MIWDLIRLLSTVILVAVVGIGSWLLYLKVQEGLNGINQQLKHRGISLSQSGMSIKTDRRSSNLEQTQDAIQAGIMKGWENSTFNVGKGVLGKHIDAKHDKNFRAGVDKTHRKTV